MTNPYRERLVAMADELEARQARIQAHDRAGVPADFAEQATARENDEVVHALGSQGAAELQRVRAALRRIEADSFGRCLKCGESIEAARLDALPYAEHCARCAE